MDEVIVYILLIVVLPLVIIMITQYIRYTRLMDNSQEILRTLLITLNEQRDNHKQLLTLLQKLSAAETQANAGSKVTATPVDNPALTPVSIELPNPNAITAVSLPDYPLPTPTQIATTTPLAWSEPTLPAEPSRFELAAKQILLEIWNWIIVGAEHRQEGMSIEYAVASNWLLRVGVIILVTGIGFFLKYSIDNNLLGEHARVTLSVLAGIGMLYGGVKLIGGRYHLFSQGLLGGGIAVLYFSIFAAFSFYHLLGMYSCFALMLLITASSAFLAINLNSMLVAIFAIIGGYCTPILLATGQVNFVGLFSYLLLLGSGILAINWYKHWHLLNALSFLFTYVLFFAAMQHYETSYFWQVFPFLSGFFLLFSTTVFLFNLVNRNPANLLDLLALLLNAGVFFATAYDLITAIYAEYWVAALSVAMASIYIAHVYYCLSKQFADRNLLVSFIGLAAFFLIIALPLLFAKQWLTVSWSLLALVMLWMSGKLRSAFLQQVAYLLYLLMLIRFCCIDLPEQYSDNLMSAQTSLQFWLGLLERLISFGIPIASLGFAYRLVAKPTTTMPQSIDSKTDLPLWLPNRTFLTIVTIIAASLLFIVLQLEFYHSLAYLYPPLQLPTLTLVWLAAGLLTLKAYQSTQADWTLKVMQFLLAGVILKLVCFDLPAWEIGFGAISDSDDLLTMRYLGTYSFQSTLLRLLDFGSIIGVLLFGYWQLQPAGAVNPDIRPIMVGTALALLFTFLSLETNSILYQYLPGLRSGGVSILWSLFGLALVLTGIKRQIKLFRLAGLGLFALVAWKVFFVDLARLEQIYRIIAFIILGLLALAGAFTYMRFQQNFINPQSEDKSND